MLATNAAAVRHSSAALDAAVGSQLGKVFGPKASTVTGMMKKVLSVSPVLTHTDVVPSVVTVRRLIELVDVD